MPDTLSDIPSGPIGPESQAVLLDLLNGTMTVRVELAVGPQSDDVCDHVSCLERQPSAGSEVAGLKRHTGSERE